MKTIIAILFTLLFSGIYGQDQPVCTKGHNVPTPEKQFQTDIKNNDLKIFTVGGLKPYNHDTVQAFENKYGIN